MADEQEEVPWWKRVGGVIADSTGIPTTVKLVQDVADKGASAIPGAVVGAPLETIREVGHDTGWQGAEDVGGTAMDVAENDPKDAAKVAAGSALVVAGYWTGGLTTGPGAAMLIQGASGLGDKTISAMAAKDKARQQQDAAHPEGSTPAFPPLRMGAVQVQSILPAPPAAATKKGRFSKAWEWFWSRLGMGVKT